MTIPETGGRWLRDPKTGALTPLSDGGGAAPAPAREPQTEATQTEAPQAGTPQHEADATPDEAPAPARKGK